MKSLHQDLLVLSVLFVLAVGALLWHTRFSLQLCPGDAVGAYRLDRWTGQVQAYGDATSDFRVRDEPTPLNRDGFEIIQFAPRTNSLLRP